MLLEYEDAKIGRIKEPVYMAHGLIQYYNGDKVIVGGEASFVGCHYYIIILLRLTLEDELILIPKKYIEIC